MKRMSTLIMTSVTLSLLFAINPKTSAQTTVTLPGDFESEMGCAYDWQPDCNATRLSQTGPTTWEATFLIPKGNWEYKVAYDNSWTENYGLNGISYGQNIPLSVPLASMLHFSFSTVTHLVNVTYVGPGGPSTVVMAGSFQSELGCAGDWQPDCGASALMYDYDSKLWTGLFAIPVGNYEFKVTIDNSWSENYGLGGVLNGPNIPLAMPVNKRALFRYNPETHIVTTTIVDYSVTLAGSFQSELGCAGDWQPDCAMSSLTFNVTSSLWEKNIRLPAGNWEYKVTIDGSWSENYGAGGVLGGPNISLALTEPSTVSFTYNPANHIVIYTATPDIVVLPGTFQPALGCSSTWDPTCDNTRLSYDLSTNLWTGTFDIPAGYWEYKVALNHSWSENYGLYGIRGGPNIPLSLETPATIQFNYDPISHYVTLLYKKMGLCVTAFYDANANDYKEWDENITMNDVAFTLSDTAGVNTSIDSTGKTCFTNLPAGQYTIKANMPPRYYSSTADSQTVYLSQPQSLYFGAVCLGRAGAENVSFWMNKKGQAAFDSLPWQKDYILSVLRYFYLVDVNGENFDPWTYNDFAKWMQQSNAKNMAYKLSVQLAALYLNSEVRMLGNRSIYTAGANYWGYQRDFMYLSNVVWYVNQLLMPGLPGTSDKDNRKDLEEWVKILDHANSDLTFVQLAPCTNNATTSTERKIETGNTIQIGNALVWPNPSRSHFNLQPSMDIGKVEIRVLDAQGKVVFAATGSASKTYTFGQGLTPGLYFVEIIQNGQHSSRKLLKE
jgi:hypothetical protein